MDNEIKYHKIHPISHFRDHFNDILNEMNNSCEPVIVTKKGKPVGIFLSPASFNEYILLKEEADIYKAIEKSQGEIENGNFLTHKELKSRINNLLK